MDAKTTAVSISSSHFSSLWPLQNNHNAQKVHYIYIYQYDKVPTYPKITKTIMGDTGTRADWQQKNRWEAQVYQPICTRWLSNLCTPMTAISYLALNRLYRIDHNGNSPVRQCLKALLCVDIYSGEPAAEAGMGVIPAYYHLRSPSLL